MRAPRWTTLIAGAPLAVLLWAFLPSGGEAPPTFGKALRGINLAGAEFGSEALTFSCRNPGAFGKEYTYPSPATIRYFSDWGFKKVRLPIRWERVQPRLLGELNSQELVQILNIFDACQESGLKVLLDLHNYGRYKTGSSDAPQGHVIDSASGRTQGVTRVALADFWLRVSEVLRPHAALEGFGLMNEPHDMQTSDWPAISQHVVTALRDSGDRSWIYVAGDNWSHAHDWAKHNGPTPWINDPVDQVVYEAHCYFDSDASGTYKSSFIRELDQDPATATRGTDRLRPFLNWCVQNQVRGIIGEFGIPRDDRGWDPVLGAFLELADEVGLETYAWAGGDWWGDYPLSLQPENGLHARALGQMFRD